jgi:hypothetical protein
MGYIELNIDTAIKYAERLKALEDEVQQLKVQTERTCTWTVDYYCGEPIKWDTTCGEAWNWYEGGLAANNVRYCHGCGGTIVEVDEPPKWGDEEDAGPGVICNHAALCQAEPIAYCEHSQQHAPSRTCRRACEFHDGQRCVEAPNE